MNALTFQHAIEALAYAFSFLIHLPSVNICLAWTGKYQNFAFSRHWRAGDAAPWGAVP